MVKVPLGARIISWVISGIFRSRDLLIIEERKGNWRLILSELHLFFIVRVGPAGCFCCTAIRHFSSCWSLCIPKPAIFSHYQRVLAARLVGPALQIWNGLCANSYKVVDLR
jgi:hypothetical protein